MLEEKDIVEINNILKLCGVSRLSDSEIDYLNAIETTITEDCDYYKTAQTVLLDRMRNESCKSNALARLNRLAETNGCQLQQKEPEKPAAIPIYVGGGIG